MQQEGNNSTGNKSLNRSLSDEDEECMDDEEINVEDTQFIWSDLPDWKHHQFFYHLTKNTTDLCESIRNEKRKSTKKKRRK